MSFFEWPAERRDAVKVRLISAAVILLTILAYHRVLDCDFLILDDQAFITGNHWVARGLSPEGVRWAFSLFESYMWKPLTWISHMTDVTLFGMNPAGHHAVNLILHAGNVLLLFLFLRRTTGALWKSAFVAAVFAVHPLNVESVAWVAERKNVLCAFWGILALLAYCEYVKERRWYMFLAVVASFGLGLMSKPMLVTWPFVMVLLDIWPLNRLQQAWEAEENGPAGGSRSVMAVLKAVAAFMMEKTPLLLMSVAVGLLTYIVQKTAGAMPVEWGFGPRLANVLTSYASYLGDMIFPLQLTPMYLLSRNLPLGEVIGAGVLLSILTLSALAMYKRAPYWVVGWFWYLGILVPVIGIIQVGSQARADRYMYLPMIGLLIAVVWGAGELWKRFHLRKSTAAVVCVLVLGAFTLATGAQVRHWQNQVTLFEHTLRVDPNNFLAHFHLGTALRQKGRYDKALDHFNASLRLKPDYDQPIGFIGMILVDRKRYVEAEKYYREFLRINPHSVDIRRDLGVVLFAQGRYDEAVRELVKCLETKPGDSRARETLDTLVSVWLKQGARRPGRTGARGGGGASND